MESNFSDHSSLPPLPSHTPLLPSYGKEHSFRLHRLDHSIAHVCHMVTACCMFTPNNADLDAAHRDAVEDRRVKDDAVFMRSESSVTDASAVRTPASTRPSSVSTLGVGAGAGARCACGRDREDGHRHVAEGAWESREPFVAIAPTTVYGTVRHDKPKFSVRSLLLFATFLYGV
jgi:hypothetical protein